MKKLFFIKITAAICWVNSALAQTDSVNIKADSSYLETVTVTALRQPLTVAQSADAVTVLSLKGWLSTDGGRTTPEWLMQETSVFVQKTNHGGGSVFIRGLTGHQTLLLIDGIRLNNATFRYGPNQYLNTIDPFSIEKMDILRGGGSVAYGSDALGGTVQVFSHSLEVSKQPLLKTLLLARATTQKMEQAGHARLTYSRQRWAATAAYSYRHFGDLWGGDTTRRQAPTGYQEQAFDAKIYLKISDKWSLTALHQSVRQDSVPVFHKVVLENFAFNHFVPQNRRLSYARLGYEADKGIFRTAAVTVSHQATEEGRSSLKNGSQSWRYEHDAVQSFGVNAQVNTHWARGWHSVQGVEIYRDIVQSDRFDTDLSRRTVQQKRGLYPNGSVQSQAAAYTLHHYQKGVWSLAAGLRYNLYDISINDTYAGQARLNPAALVWNASILRGGPRFQVFASVGTAFRAPNIDDLGTLGIVDFRYEVPNLALSPEKSMNKAIGSRWQWGKRWRGEAHIFHNQLQNLITRVRVDTQTVQGYPLYQKENIERGFIQGIEAQLQHNLTAYWQLSGSLTYTYGQNQTLNEPLRRIPPLNGRLALSWQRAGWFVQTDFRAAQAQTRLAAGDRADNRIPIGGTPAWGVLSASAGYMATHWRLQCVAHNLTNTDYRLHGSGINGMGRSATLQLSVHL